MPLTDLQIDRYSRQIIVGGIGGRGQERLLASSIVIVGDEGDIETPLAYLVGAGVGEIRVVTADRVADSLIARMRNRNPDVSVRAADDRNRAANLVLAALGSTKGVALAQQSFEQRRQTAAIMARLDEPSHIAVIPSPPPCPRCMDADLFAPFGSRASAADFVAMVATGEALKLLAGSIEKSKAHLVEFERYETRTRLLASSSRCDCGGSTSGGKADGH